MKAAVTFANNLGPRAVQRNILEMSRVDPRLWGPIWELAEELSALGAPFKIKEVFYPQGAYGSKSKTHPEFRAVDVAARGMDGKLLPEDVCRRIEERINRKYAGFGIGMKACVFHKGKTEWHFHLQVPRRDINAQGVVGDFP